MTRRPSGAAARREAVVARVIAAVERLLAQGHAFTALSVATIAEEAGVARSTFYVHFADKTELLIRMAEAGTADIVAEGERWVAADHAGGIEQLTLSVARIIAAYRRHQLLLDAVLAATGYDPSVAAFWRRHIEVIVEAGTARLRQAQADGELAAEIAVEPLARMVAWSIERTVSIHAAERPASDDPELAAAMARALWLMMYGDAPAPPGGRRAATP